MLLPKKIRVLLILFLFVDLAISFNQYYNTPIDGDLTSVVLPSGKYKPVLHDPFGIEAITTNLSHSESNRFFSISTAHTFFRTFPFVAQKWMSPISSIYFSSAIFKLLTHILIILLLSAYIFGGFNFREDRFIISSALFTIFFQVGGYSSTMGIVDSAITYTISYSFPLALLLILFYPLVLKYIHGKELKFKLPILILFSSLAIVIPFFGNQIPFIVFTILLLNLISRINSKKLGNGLLDFVNNNLYKFILGAFVLFCFYSFFLSLYNSERNIQDISLLDRYLHIPMGLKNILFGKPGLWILSLLIAINTFHLKLSGSEKSKSFIRMLKLSAAFILIDVLLQPMDGYYEFRQNIIRRDNFLPCIIIMMFLFVQSCVFIFEIIPGNSKSRKVLSVYAFGIILLFSAADLPSLRKDNCERASLEMLSISNEKIVRLSDQCTIASWYIISDAKESQVNATVFQFWKITGTEKLYYQN